MANVKITELVELAAGDIAGNDVLPIVDVGADATKKVTIVSLRSYADANDYATYTTLNSSINNTQSNVNTVQSNILAYATQANINLDTKANVSATYFAALANDYSTYTVLVGSIANTNSYITANYSTLLQLNTVQDNVAALNSRVVQNTWYTYSDNTVTTSANIIPSGNNFQTLGSPSKVWGDVYVGPGTVYLGSVRLSDVGGALTITSSDNATTSIDTKTSNITAAINSVQSNVGTLTTSTNTIKANVDSVQSNVTALTTSTNTIKANVDSVQSNVGTAVTNINTVQSNVTTLTTSTNTIKANVDSVQANVTNIINGTTAFTGNITVNRDLVISGNLVVGGATSTILTTDTVLKDRVITLSNGAASASFDTGLYINRGTSGNVFVGFDESAKQFVAAYTNDEASNAVTDFTIASYANVRFNTITADGLINNVDVANVPTNINTVQSNVGTLTTSVNTIAANVNSVQSNVGTLTTSVNTIQSNVNSVQSNVGTLTTSTNTIRANVNSVQSNVGTLTTSVNTIAANVNSVQSNVANITNGTTAFTGVTTTFNKNVVVSGNVTIGTNTSNTLIIVGSIDLGALT